LDKKIVGLKKATKSRQPVTAEMRGAGLVEKVKSWKPGFIFGRSIDRMENGPFKWVLVDNDHFVAAFVPAEGLFSQVHIKTDKKTTPIISIPVTFRLEPGETRTQNYQLFVGPKKLSVLREAGYDLDQTVNFGFFGIISKGLLATLNFFRELTGNFGWAIIIVTILYELEKKRPSAGTKAATK